MVSPYPSAARHDAGGMLVPRAEHSVMAPQHRPPARHAQPAAESASGMTPARIIHAMMRWWWISVPIGVVMGVGAAAAVWFTYVPQFRATAWLRIENRRPVLVFENEKESSPMFLRTQVELIRSPLVTSRVLSRPEIAALPEIRQESVASKWLSSRISVKSVGESEIFQIIFDAPRPESAALIANAVLDSYLHVQGELTDTQTHRTIELLESEKAKREADVQRLQNNLRNLTKQWSGSDPGAIRPNEIMLSQRNPLMEMHNQMTETEMKRSVLEARYRAMYEQFEKQMPASAGRIEREVEEAAPVQKLKADIFALKARLREAESVLVGDSTGLTSRLKSDLASREESLTRLRQDLAAQLAKEIQGVQRAEHEVTLNGMKTEIDSLKMIEMSMQQKVDQMKTEIAASGNRSLDLEIARGELAQGENVLQRISDRITALRTELRAPARISPLNRATPSESVLQGDCMMKMLAVALGCFVFPLGLSVLWEQSLHRVGTSQQLTQEAQVPVIAEIASLPMRSSAGGRSVADERLRNVFKESIDQLRTRLTLPDHLQHLRVLAVASAVSGEGKTSLASHLALSLARTHREPVLLIDADMRAPDIHSIFNISLSPGLAEVLEQKCSVSEAIDKSWNELVHLLPAGELQKNPHMLMTPEAIHDLLTEVRPLYRYIVIDSPPLLAASEAFVIAKAADGSIVCAMRDKSRVSQVKTACERLFAAGVTPLGAVLSGVSSNQYTRQYGTYGFHS